MPYIKKDEDIKGSLARLNVFVVRKKLWLLAVKNWIAVVLRSLPCVDNPTDFQYSGSIFPIKFERMISEQSVMWFLFDEVLSNQNSLYLGHVAPKPCILSNYSPDISDHKHLSWKALFQALMQTQLRSSLHLLLHIAPKLNR